ncbi:MAG: hypothetical protein KAU83_05395, partial [Bacteroidales bacterium]|nr:hypothetical protein [Bacteroidales bacterium]
MKVNRSTLNRLSGFRGYLEGKKLDAFFETYGIKFAAGHWCAGDFCDRFAPLGYNSDNPDFKSDIISQIERVAKAGIKGIEFHEALFIDKNFKKDGKIINDVKKALKKYKVTPTNMNMNLWSDPKWKLGGITNAKPRVR